MTKKDYNDTDDYGHTMKKSQKHVGFFVAVVIVEKNSGPDKTYKMTSKCALFSKESIVYH